jgi:hypothetical protein
MAAVLEERSTHEVLDQNEAIETLKMEVEVLGAEKTYLMVEVGDCLPLVLKLKTFRKKLSPSGSRWRRPKLWRPLLLSLHHRLMRLWTTSTRKMILRKKSSLALQQQLCC